MRLFSSILSITIILSLSISQLDAKKRGGWSGSKRSSKKSSFTTRYKSSSPSFSSSFDRERDNKAKERRSSSAYKEYVASKNTLSQSNNHNSQTPKSGGRPEIDIDIELPSQTYFPTSREQRISSPVNSLYVIIGFVVIIGGVLYILSYRKRKKPIKELPLDIRLGGIVDLDALETRFTLNRDNFKMKIPRTLKGYITAIGEVQLDHDLQIYNVYVSENIDDREPMFTLKIELVNNVISVAKIFTVFEKVYPSTVKDWEEWLDGDADNYPYLGGLEFGIQSGEIFKRVWESGVEEVVRTKFIENVSKEDSHIETLNIVSLYGRELDNGEIEYLYLSNIEDSNLNNFIKIELGIAVKESELVVI